MFYKYYVIFQYLVIFFGFDLVWIFFVFDFRVAEAELSLSESKILVRSTSL